jgi:hypothetical protein
MFGKPLLSGLPNVFYNRCNSQKPNSNYNKLITNGAASTQLIAAV